MRITKTTKSAYEAFNGPIIYIKLYPSDMDGDHFQNYHLFEVKYDKDNDSYVCKSNRTHCERYTMNSEASIIDGQIIEPQKAHRQDEYFNQVRLYLANEQNTGTDFCAHCVGKFYKEEL